MTQQTAVEWLVDRLLEGNPHILYWAGKDVEQAKQMEKEQIVNAYNQDLYGGLSGDKKFDDGEQYYNETYNK